MAADDPQIVSVVQGFGGEAWLTDLGHSCGTDRIAEVAARLPQYELIVNVQGDEPELAGAAIDLALSVFVDQPTARMATLATPIRERSRLESPNCVKVVMDQNHRALYFSRAPVPFVRDWDDRWLAHESPCFHQHIGLYAYRRDFLLEISQAPACLLERLESLEQLRALHRGVPIHVRIVAHSPQGIDTPEDYRAFVRRIDSR